MKRVGETVLILAICCLFCLPSFCQSDSDVLVVPKGTQIQTDISRTSPGTPATPYEYYGKVEIPVRLGFSTAIPVGSKVNVRITATHSSEGPQFAAELVGVTIDGKSLKIRTDRIPVVDPSTVKEVTFTLLEPLKISR